MKKTHVMIHHSATKDTGSVSWGAIRKYHVEVNGWADIGYHLGVELVNGHYEVMLGRAFDADGAHCFQGGMNRRALGVCFVGNFDAVAPPGEMLVFAARHLRRIMADLAIPPYRAHVLRHGDYAPKTCPGKLFPFDAFVALLAAPADTEPLTGETPW